MSAAEVCQITGHRVPRLLAATLARPVQPEPQDAETLRRLQALATAMGPRGRASIASVASGASYYIPRFNVTLADGETLEQQFISATTDAALTAAEAWVAARAEGRSDAQ